MTATLELRRQLKAATQKAHHDEVLEIAGNLWDEGAREPGICLVAYRSALANHNGDLAEAWADRGLEEKGHPFAWRFLGLKGELRGRTGDWEKALEFFQQASQAAPNEALPLAQVGKAYLRLGRFGLSADALRRSVNLVEVAHPAWLVDLGMAELKLGNLAQAKEAFTSSNEARPQPKLGWMISDIDRRLASGSPSSTEATAGFYDDVFASREEYRLSWKESAYVPSWLSIIDTMKEERITAVLDLGCGPGQFAGCLSELLPGVAYHGVDFSPVAVQQAKSLFPNYRFSCIELPLRDYRDLGAMDCVVCTEVLEHVTDDIPILDAIPEGVVTIFSVPNFDSFGHVRNFRTSEDVHCRYGHLFEKIEIEAFPMGGTRVLWLARGIRRAKA